MLQMRDTRMVLSKHIAVASGYHVPEEGERVLEGH